MSEPKSLLTPPARPMRIANPIYDSVFKHLMENLEIARGLIARLLGVEILDLTPQPHEVTERQAAGVGDAQALMRVYRIDFSATMKQADGREHRVLIELQKASKCEAVSRSATTSRATTPCLRLRNPRCRSSLFIYLASNSARAYRRSPGSNANTSMA